MPANEPVRCRRRNVVAAGMRAFRAFQVKESPPIEEDQPVSRRHEQRLLSHYHYHYWTGPLTWGHHHIPSLAAVPNKSVAPEPEKIPEKAAHLRSAGEVDGYSVQAKDDGIGHVEDFLVDDADWRLRYVIVDTVNWLPGRKVLVATGWFKDVSWAKREVRVDLTRAQVKDSPEFRPGTMNRRYEEQLFRHFGAEPYWEAQSQEDVLKVGATRLPPD